MAIGFKLPRLLQGWDTQPKLLERYWDIAMSQIEDVVRQLLAIPAIQEALVMLDTAIDAANTAAANAQNAADQSMSESSLVNSYVANFTAPLISADSSGNVTIANHDRVYGDSVLNPTVAVTGGVIATGEANPSVIRVYYNDVSRAGGAVIYQYTVDPAAPPVQGGSTHSVGAITIPSSGTGNGNYVRPPGYVQEQ